MDMGLSRKITPFAKKLGRTNREIFIENLKRVNEKRYVPPKDQVTAVVICNFKKK